MKADREMSTRGLSVRSQLLLMVLAILLPAAGIVVWYVAHDSQEAQESAYAQVKILADNVAANLQHLLSENEEVLGHFVERPLVKALDPKNCDPILDMYVKARPDYNTLAIRDASANIVCTLLPNSPSAQIVKEFPWFKEAVRTGKFTIGDANFRPSPPAWVSISALPIRDERQNVSGLVFFSIDLLKLNQRLFQSVRKDALVEVVDHDGRFLLHSIDPGQWIGNAPPHPLTDEVRGQREGFISVPGIDNIKRLYAYVTVPGTSWRVFASLPEDEVLGLSRERLAIGGALGFAVLILVLFLAWRIGLATVNPIHELVRTSSKIAGGDTSARVTEQGGSREIRMLGQTFNEMAVALQNREMALKEAQRLAQVGGWEWTLGTDTMIWSEELYRIHNHDSKLPPLHLKDMADRCDPESRERLNAANDRARQAGTSYELDLKTVGGRWAAVRGEAVRDAPGRIVKLRGTWQDITERKQAEEQKRFANEQLRDFATRLSAIREAESTHLSRELHDEIGQDLIAAQMDIGWIISKLPKDQKGIKDRAEQALDTIDVAINSAVNIAARLRPPILDDAGIIGGLEWQAQEFQDRVEIVCRLISNTSAPSLKPEQDIALYRIVQEALTNVARHSAATEVEIRVCEEAGCLTLTIRDDGKGIASEALADRKSIGLVGMNERALAIGARFVIEGSTENGTTVTVVVPLAETPRSDLPNQDSGSDPGSSDLRVDAQGTALVRLR